MNTERSLKQHLYVDLVICGSVYGAVKSKPNHKYPSVYRKPGNKRLQVTKGEER